MSTIHTARAVESDSSADSRFVDRDRHRTAENVRDKSLTRDTEIEPTPRSWMIIAAGSVVPLGLAIAAAVTTYITTTDRVAVTAWIAVAIVGTASVISTAVASRRRISTIDREKLGLRSVDQAHGVSKSKGD